MAGRYAVVLCEYGNLFAEDFETEVTARKRADEHASHYDPSELEDVFLAVCDLEKGTLKKGERLYEPFSNIDKEELPGDEEKLRADLDRLSLQNLAQIVGDKETLIDTILAMYDEQHRTLRKKIDKHLKEA